MSTPITNIPKPEAKRFKDGRKVFLVPIYIIPPGISDEGDAILERYWTEVRDHLNNLESTLGKASHIFHEAIFDAGDVGMKAVEILNLKAYPLIQEMSKSGGKLEATEDKMAVHESSDWQRCYVRMVDESEVYMTNENVLNRLQTRPTFWGSKPAPPSVPAEPDSL